MWRKSRDLWPYLTQPAAKRASEFFAKHSDEGNAKGAKDVAFRSNACVLVAFWQPRCGRPPKLAPRGIVGAGVVARGQTPLQDFFLEKKNERSPNATKWLEIVRGCLAMHFGPRVASVRAVGEFRCARRWVRGVEAPRLCAARGVPLDEIF